MWYLSLALKLAPWVGIVAAALTALYYRSRALRAEAAVTAVAHADATADSELKATAAQRTAALAQMAKEQQAAHDQDVVAVRGASAADVAKLLQGGSGAGGGPTGALPASRPGTSPSGKIGLPQR